ncbi:aminotransferase class III-fold pyridoxal phosphate-dependent enzyme [Labrenzia sp. DG1229]|uniref:aminotransferase class III-fold pyridoxal phosphate-dependent enzyme n=1 Tax=Labrenzia sp. DG1229 TaxID=681847 RepID=UPI000690375C|nr:aminotransferase class III-fold pyridoxal phosphate-dependent enzyme [Labrenzia sp. DG1229]
MKHDASSTAQRFQEGCQLLEDASQWVVGGVKRMNILDMPQHYPLFFDRACGPFAWDVDDNRYIDLIGGKGSVLFGYSDPDIDHATVAAIGRGVMLPLTPKNYHLAARELCSMVESIEMVKFFKTGSCAVAAGIRLARTFSGRKKVLSCGYHGWHDWFITERTRYPDTTGITVDFFYDIDALKLLLLENRDDIAAVVVTPEPSFFEAQFLRDIEELCRLENVIFFLDEVKTAFRFGAGGYQALAEVTPDLSAFGKSIANGYALAALGGRADVMNAEHDTHISGTYETESVGLAAGITCMKKIAKTDYSVLRTLYNDFSSTVNELFQEHGIAARVFSSSGNAQIIFEDTALATQFYRLAAAAGVTFYVNDDVNLTFSHVGVFKELLEKIDLVAKEMPKNTKILLSEDAIGNYWIRHRITSPELLHSSFTSARLRELAESEVFTVPVGSP